ncbi:MAG: sulfatase, partial [Planctomycetaceae bacterium]|nr:sulfatase [Planctomycetaceae bacterium]
MFETQHRLPCPIFSRCPIATVMVVLVGASLLGHDAHGQDSRPTSPPNIIFILADDLGWTDVGCFGSRFYETPNIDRLAREGMRFTAAYSNGPNCAPTRACLMSGQYTPRHGIYTVGTGSRGKPQFRKAVPVVNKTVLPQRHVTPAEILRKAGYATAHMGKWHLGSPPTEGPSEQGFDLNVAGGRRGSPASYFSPYRNGQLKNGPKGEYLTDRLTDEALTFIEANRDGPFFLYLPHYAVHTPLQAKEDLIAKYRKKPPVKGHRNPVYAAMIQSLDESVGRILDKLDELKLTEKTVVVFTSDNGGLGGYADAGIQGAKDVSSNAPLRGGKGMLYEGGIRVPQIVRWRKVVEPGSECAEPVVTLDFYPTLAEIAGATLDPAQQLDGKSLLPLLKSAGKATLDREAIYWHFPGYLEANAKRGTWRTTPAGAIRQGRYKLIEFFENNQLKLYDLQEDISERHNLAETNP